MVVLALGGFLVLGLSGVSVAASGSDPGPLRHFMVPLPDAGVLALPPGASVLYEYPDYVFISSRKAPQVPGAVEMDYTVKLWGIGEFFDPLSTSPVVPAGYEDPWSSNAPDEIVYGIVQFAAPMRASWESGALAGGVQLVQPLSGFAYIARGAKGAFETLAEQPEVRWVGEYHHFYKFRGEAWNLLQTESPSSESRFWMFVFDPDSAQVPGIVDSITSSGGRIHNVWHSPGSMYHTIQFWTQWKNVPDLVKWRGVYTLEDFPDYTIFNAQASWALQADQSGVRPIHDKGITGKGVILAVADTGVDKDHANFKSVPNKIVRYWACADGDDTQGHGSHVSGTVLGDGGTAGSYDPSKFDGMAFEALLSMQDIAVGGSIQCATPSQNGVEAVKDGALVEQNSWGTPSCAGSYGSGSQDADGFMIANPGFLFSFSAGNSGPSADTIACPATGKNVLTVGATNKGGAKTMAGFSSRGPTDDGRIKPTINAPGVDMDSVANNAQYTQMSGTSMSGPAAAGMNGLTAQYFMEGWYPAGLKGTGQQFTPSAAMMKAMLVASGSDQKAQGGDATNFIPDQNAQGYGKIKLSDVLYFDGGTQKLWVLDGYNSSFNTPGLKTGEKKTFSVKIKAAGPFKVALVWNDPAGANLVNNLDLMVTSPSGKKYAGNDFDGQGQSKEGGAAPDTKNVEEIMHLKTPEEGGYSIEISAVNIGQGNEQMFSVVAVGNDLVGGGAILFEKPAPGEIIMGNVTYDVPYRAVGDVVDGTVEISFSVNGGPGTVIASAQPKIGTVKWNVPKVDEPKVKLQAKGKDSKGADVTAESGEFGIDSSPPATNIDPVAPFTKTKDIDLILKGGDAVSGLDNVELWYKKDSAGAVKSQDVARPLPTAVKFTSTSDGRYDFYTVGVDKSGNREPIPAPADASTLIDTKPPTVKKVNPPDSAPAVSTLTSISVEFAELMDEPATESAFKVTPSTTGAFSWNGRTLNFKPSGPLAVATTYSIAVTIGASDKVGWPMAAEYKWSFKTTPNQPDPGNVDGHVYDAIPETPVDGAKVALLFPGTTFEMASVTTGADGKWSVENIDAGEYTIEASKTGYKTAQKKVTTSGGGNWLRDVDFYLFNTTSSDGALEVVVRSTEGNALPGATVQVKGETKGTTNEKGVLLVKPLQAGGYSIKVDREGFKSNQTTAVVKAQMAEQVVIKLAPVPFDFGMILGWMPFIIIIVIVAVAAGAVAKTAGRRECMYCHKKYKKSMPACPSCGFQVSGGAPPGQDQGPPPMGGMPPGGYGPPGLQQPAYGSPPGYGGPPVMPP